MIFKKVRRQLKVTLAGRWYLGLTIVLGVVAVSSGNNILYLLESFLLGGLLLSGVVSERSLREVKVYWKRNPCSAGSATTDRIEVRNDGRMPIFCLDVGEWKEKKFHPIAFVPYLGPGRKVLVKTSHSYAERGMHSWEGIACATRYPFGFAQKIRWWATPGSRLVWPEKTATKNRLGDGDVRGGENRREAKVFYGSQKTSQKRGTVGMGPFADAEVRPVAPGDDYRYVVWTLSALREEPVVRLRRQEMSDFEVVLDLRSESGRAFEEKVKEAALSFYRNEAGLGALILVSSKGRHRFEGVRKSLDVLATVRPEKEAA